MNRQNHKSQEAQGIQRFYTRQMQNQYHNSYYLTPRDECPIDVLQDRQRFVILTFDKQDNYIVVDNKRYYLTKMNSIKATDKLDQRIAIVDISELEKSKSYPYDKKYRHDFTAVFDSFDQLHALARKQYASQGTVFVKQVAIYHESTNNCTYEYEPSCDSSLLTA